MSLIPHHVSDPVCPYCEEKLSLAMPELSVWFHSVKLRYPNLHVSWSFRDQADQEQAFSDKKSDLHFPHSPHNVVPSLAIDVFQIDEAGKGVWDKDFLAQLNEENIKNGFNLKWGGLWRSLGDSCHFQVGD